MPSGAVHTLFYQVCGLTKEESAALQVFIDGASRYIPGKAHRHINHDYSSLLPFLMVHGRGTKKSMQIVAAFTSHIVLDKMATKDKRFKAMVEMLPLMKP